jgi:hypothetical protein
MKFLEAQEVIDILENLKGIALIQQALIIQNFKVIAYRR